LSVEFDAEECLNKYGGICFTDKGIPALILNQRIKNFKRDEYIVLLKEETNKGLFDRVITIGRYGEGYADRFVYEQPFFLYAVYSSLGDPVHICSPYEEAENKRLELRPSCLISLKYLNYKIVKLCNIKLDKTIYSAKEFLNAIASDDNIYVDSIKPFMIEESHRRFYLKSILSLPERFLKTLEKDFEYVFLQPQHYLAEFLDSIGYKLEIDVRIIKTEDAKDDRM
jgi:uncharacterized protein (DUF1499 family)